METNRRTNEALTVGDIINKNRSIFFGEPLTEEERIKRGIRNAKITLAGDILTMRMKAGERIYGRDFDRLYDMSLNRLHREVIITQDRLFFENNP
jgi:hypothetical protein